MEEDKEISVSALNQLESNNPTPLKTESQTRVSKNNSRRYLNIVTNRRLSHKARKRKSKLRINKL